MIASETLPDMNKSISLRQLAGAIVRDEMARQRLNRRTAAKDAKMAPSTLARVINGDETVTDVTLRQVEGALDLPRRILTLVINGDEARLRELDMEADLRTYVVSSVIDIKTSWSSDEKASKRSRRGE